MCLLSHDDVGAVRSERGLFLEHFEEVDDALAEALQVLRLGTGRADALEKTLHQLLDDDDEGVCVAHGARMRHCLVHVAQDVNEAVVGGW